MSDSTSGVPSAEPDFLDRLLARHTPAAGPRPGVVQVRPRLAGPFERIEAVRSIAADPDGTEPLWPTAAPAAVPRQEPPAPAAPEVRHHTERERTVVRTEQVPPLEPALRPAPQAGPEAPLLRPASPVSPGPRPVPDPSRSATGRVRTENPSPSAASVPTPPGMDAASSAAVSAALLPSAADTAAARDAVRQAAARRPRRGAEQVVQVQIGRLEVTADATPQRVARPGPRTAVRPEAALSLADYLTRDRR
ncbi:hypothetical protein ACWDG1_07770 [Streptomyces sp. NPDC001177]